MNYSLNMVDVGITIYDINIYFLNWTDIGVSLLPQHDKYTRGD